MLPSCQKSQDIEKKHQNVQIRNKNAGKRYYFDVTLLDVESTSIKDAPM